MKDYQPISLEDLCNVNSEDIDVNITSDVGPVSFHGLPFHISDGTKTFLGFGDGANTEPIQIPVKSSAQRIIFVHRLLESRIPEGEVIGKLIANYVFNYKDGENVSVPIRERFEIGSVPQGWGQQTFIAIPDTQEGLHARHQGPWGSAGNRQTEATQCVPRNYYLFIWKNPHPDKEISSIEIQPEERKFIIAAITLGHLDEDPVPRHPNREVLITLPKPEDAEKPFDMEVNVDRGTATYPYALPENTVDGFINDDFKGWGETQNSKSSPAYTEISATPSATVEVKNDGETLGSVNWGEVQEKGSIQPNDRVKVEVIDSGRNWVHTTVIDEDTNKPVPCRIHFRSPHGVPYAPHGHHAHVNSNMGTWHIDVGGDVRLGQISYAYIDGTCQGWLPRGEVIVDVARGFEYTPLRTKVNIEPGQRELTLRIKRWCDMNSDRYFSGDTHVHFLSTQGAHTEAQGEDLGVVNLLLSQWGHLFTNTEEFIGRPTTSADGRSIVYATQENRQHVLGHLTLLGLKEQVAPWCSDGPGEAELGGNMEVTLSHWADACHQQGGTVVLPHIPNPNCEPATLIATNRVDAVEYLTNAMYGHIEYYRYLNCGYKLPLVGGTDKMTADVPVGVYRTYVHIPENEEFNYDNWCKYMSRGNTFLSGGPMIRLSVDGQPIGSTINLPGNGGTVEVEASADSIFPIHTLQIIQAGEVVASTEETNGSNQLRIKAHVKVDKHSWIAARCGGPEYAQAVPHHDGWRRGIIAHTSPIYLAVGGEWWMFDPETAKYMLTLIEGGLSYIEQSARHYEHGTTTHHHGEDNHIEYLSRPFQEAREAIHQRMHKLGIPH
ncbi:CehA/McbA family metallohydrolase [Candidatus Poribacteria bacterium]|nr:CehA/McbA family metallohydrolase [Candidatus Poribacteria bacterium]